MLDLPYEKDLLEYAFSKLEVVDPDAIVDTADGRGRVLNVSIDKKKALRVLIIYDSQGRVKSVAMSDVGFAQNMEFGGEDFVEIPAKYRDLVQNRLGKYAAKDHEVDKNKKINVLVPFGYEQVYSEFVDLLSSNPLFSSVVEKVDKKVGVFNRLNFFKVKSGCDGLQSGGVILRKIDIPFNSETFIHEMIHILWENNVFSKEQKEKWIKYIERNHPDFFKIIEQLYSPFIALKSKVRGRVGDETLAYFFQVLATENGYRVWDREDTIINKGILEQFVSLGLLNEQSLEIWMKEFRRRSLAGSPDQSILNETIVSIAA